MEYWALCLLGGRVLHELLVPLRHFWRGELSETRENEELMRGERA